MGPPTTSTNKVRRVREMPEAYKAVLAAGRVEGRIVRQYLEALAATGRGSARADRAVDLTDLEEAFVKVAKSYARRKGIDYSTWRAVGVSPAVLEKAGISKTEDRGPGWRLRR